MAISLSEQESFGNKACTHDRVETIEIIPTVWQPRARRMRELVESCDFPSFICPKPLPLNANVRTG